jgi:hypothetical protein
VNEVLFAKVEVAFVCAVAAGVETLAKSTMGIINTTNIAKRTQVPVFIRNAASIAC